MYGYIKFFFLFKIVLFFFLWKLAAPPFFLNIVFDELLKKWLSLPIYVVGQASASLAKKLGYTNIYGQSTGSSENLAKVIIEDYSTWTIDIHILLLTGDKTLPTLFDELLKNNIKVVKILTYRTVLRDTFTEDLSKEIHRLYFTQNIHDIFIALFSPSAAKIAVPIISKLISEDTNFFKISQTPPFSLHLISAGPSTTTSMEIPPAIEITPGNLYPKNFARQVRLYLEGRKSF